MLKLWESVLGERILFTRHVDGRWSWDSSGVRVGMASEIRYVSQQLARIAAASMIFAFFLTEETTSTDVGLDFSSSASSLSDEPRRPGNPPQGGGGV